MHVSGVEELRKNCYSYTVNRQHRGLVAVNGMGLRKVWIAVFK
jgi:hypothetical protein